MGSMTDQSRESGGPGLPAPADMTPAEFAGTGDVVTMVFPRALLFTPRHGVRVRYPAGVNPVPREFVNHWWFINNGASLLERPQTHTPVATK